MQAGMFGNLSAAAEELEANDDAWSRRAEEALTVDIRAYPLNLA